MGLFPEADNLAFVPFTNVPSKSLLFLERLHALSWKLPDTTQALSSYQESIKKLGAIGVVE